MTATAQHPLKTFVDTQPKDFLTGLRVADALVRYFCGEEHPAQLRAGGGMFMTYFAYIRSEGFLFGTDAAAAMLETALKENPTLSGADLLLEYRKYVEHVQENVGDFYAESMASYMRLAPVEDPVLRPVRKLFVRAFAPLFQNSGVLPALLKYKPREQPSGGAVPNAPDETADGSDDIDAGDDTDDTATLVAEETAE